MKPPGATAPDASPPVLRSLKLQFEGAQDAEEGVMVNGCIAEMWSFACILYEMLTGEKPFMVEDEEAIFRRQAPDDAFGCLRQQWLVYDAFAMAQRN